MSTLMIFAQDNSVLFGLFCSLIKSPSFSRIFLLQIQFIFDKLFLSSLATLRSCCTLDDSCIYDDDDALNWWLICIIVEDDSKEHQTICKLQPIIYCLCWCGCWDQSSSDLEEIKQLSFSYSLHHQAKPNLNRPGPGCLKGWRLRSHCLPWLRGDGGWGNCEGWQFLTLILTAGDHKDFFIFFSELRSPWLVRHFLFLFDTLCLSVTVTPWVIKL